MPNHFHLVVRTGRRPLAHFMSRLETSYAGQFNRRHQRVGKLFQNRYKSIVCDEDVYFKELIAYVHLNPLRANIVKSLGELADYRWSGHRALLGKEKAPWQQVHGVLSHFGRKVSIARENYLSFLAEHKSVKSGTLSGGGLIRSQGGLEIVMQMRGGEREEYDTRVLGGGDFVCQVGKVVEGLRMRGEIQGNLVDLMKSISEQEKIPLGEIVAKGKTTARGSRARAIIAHLATTFLGKKKNHVAEEFNVTPLAVTKLCRRGAEDVGTKGESLLRRLSIV